MENQSLTFAQLKSMVGITGHGTLPTAKYLFENDEVILESGYITVFKSGYFVYLENGYTTVFAVDRIKFLYYGVDGEGNPIKIYESGFDSLPWYLVLDKIAEDRMEHNRQARDEARIEVELYDEISEFNARYGFKRNRHSTDRLEANDLESDWEEREDKERNLMILEKALLTLTARQREVINLYYSENPMTTRQIGEQFGISHQAVVRIKLAAEERLRKYFRKNGCQNLV